MSFGPRRQISGEGPVHRPDECHRVSLMGQTEPTGLPTPACWIQNPPWLVQDCTTHTTCSGLAGAGAVCDLCPIPDRADAMHAGSDMRETSPDWPCRSVTRRVGCTGPCLASPGCGSTETQGRHWELDSACGPDLQHSCSIALCS